MSDDNKLSPQELSELLQYDPESGLVFWKKRFPAHRINAIFNSRFGDKAAGANRSGYLVISVKRQNILAHRAAWVLHYGRYPDGHLDHIDGDRRNNRIRNLRECDPQGNALNRAMTTRNSSGFTNVHWATKANKWKAEYAYEKKRYTVGFFKTAEDAYAAVRSAKLALGFTERHGLPFKDTP